MKALPSECKRIDIVPLSIRSYFNIASLAKYAATNGSRNANIDYRRERKKHITTHLVKQPQRDPVSRLGRQDRKTSKIVKMFATEKPPRLSKCLPLDFRPQQETFLYPNNRSLLAYKYVSLKNAWYWYFLTSQRDLIIV